MYKPRETPTATIKEIKIMKMTKIEAVKIYKAEKKDFIKTCKANSDLVMLREDWHNYVDMLNRNGEITDSQVNRWSNPF